MLETVATARLVRPYLLDVTFADGFRRQVEREPLLWGEVLSPLRDPDFRRPGAAQVTNRDRHRLSSSLGDASASLVVRVG